MGEKINEITLEHFETALRLMFEGDEVNRRVFLARMARRHPTPTLTALADKYPYNKSILRDRKIEK